MLNYIIIVLCLIGSAFFSASEISYASSSEVRLRHAAEEKKSLASRLALRIYGDYDKALATILIGNNLVNIAAESVATVIVIDLLGESQAWVSTIGMTVLVLIFGEITPKVVAKAMPEAEENEAAYNKAYYFVEETKPREVVEDDEDEPTKNEKEVQR